MPLVPTRAATAADLASSNPILANNEVGIETDTGFVKTGDGVRTWSALPKTDDQKTSAARAADTSDETGTGANVFATSPTLVTPVLGAATATSVNGSTIPTSKTIVVTTDKLSVLAATTSAELAGVISDETGSGALVFGTSPTLVTPALGTPASGVLTNATGLPTAGLVDAAVTQAKMKTKAVVALADAAATLTAAQLVDSGIFTITPTTARALTTDTATAIVAALPSYQVGTWFDLIIVNLAAFVVTLTAGVGVTLVGVATLNNVSGTWRARIDSATAITIYRA